MNQAVSYRPAGDLNNLVQAVIVPLKNGLCSFNTLSEMLLSVNADIVLPGCQTFDNIREEIEKMKKNLEESEQLAMKELQFLDEETENLTAEQSNLDNQKKNKECELENLQIQLESNRSSLESYKEALNTEQRNLASAEQTLNDMNRKREEAQRIRDAGIGLMFIPFVGWIAGSVMIGVGQADMDSASGQVDNARREVANCEEHVRNYNNNVSDYERAVNNTQTDIQEAGRRIGEMVAKLQDLSVKRVTVADFQGKTRQAVRELGKLSGVGSVAELQTRHLILLNTMIKVIGEMMTALGQISEDELLCREDIKSIMSEMTNNHNKLKNHPKLQESLSQNNLDYY